jgi:CHAD domain-containing protein
MKARKQRSDIVVSRILLDELAVVRENIENAAAGNDPDALHELRVSVRRSRALLKGMPGVFAPADRERLARELRELQGLTGPVRDYDVLLEDLDEFGDDRPELESETAQLRVLFAKRRATAASRLARRLRSKRQADALATWERIATRLVEAGDEDRPDAAKPIGRLAAARIAEDHRRLLKLSAQALDSGDPAVIHHARKRGKALRYNLEFFGEMIDKDATRALRRSLRAVQDELGAYQDTVIRETELRSAAAADPGVALPAGALLDRTFVERDLALEAFARRYAKLARHKRRRAVEKAFAS